MAPSREGGAASPCCRLSGALGVTGHQPWLMSPSAHTCVCSRAALIKNRQRCVLRLNWYGCLVLIILRWFFFKLQAFFFPVVADEWHHLICSDTICDLGGVKELANYGEYSGAPSEQQTYDYAKTILSLMTREKHPEGKNTARPKLSV